MNFFKNYSYSMKIVIVTATLLMIGFCAYSWSYYDNGIVDYVASRDKIIVKKMFHDDYQFLYYGDWEEITVDSFNVDFMLDNRSSSQHHKDNKLVLKVLREHGKTVGFLAYYPKSPYWWHLLFLIVDKDYRRKGYATKLLQYTIDDMVLRGALKITIFTRLANVRARALYEGKFGFKDIAHHDDKYMDLAWYPKRN